jgi:uncharacterized protein YbjT (DUF2867 family)
MSEKKIIAVVGATGAQGGGLVRAILEDDDSPFTVRALTRNPSSDQARALAALGAEVVQADLDDQASLEQAFSGAYGAFCVTNFWEHLSPAREKAQARNMAEAAKAAGVKHAVWSTLEDTRDWVPLDDDRMPTLQGEYKVPHFDGKGEADAFFRDAGVPTTLLLTSFYWDNLIHFGMGPQRGEDGTLAFNLPMGERKLPAIAAEDIGRSVYGIFQRGDEFAGKTVGIAGEHLTGSQMAEALSAVLGEPVRYNAVPFDVYRGLGFPGADDMGNMFQFKHDFQSDFCGARPVEGTRALNPKLQSFRDWLRDNKDRILVDPA